MAKLGKHSIVAENKADYRERISLDVEVNVSKDGEFYCSLNQEQVDMLVDHGIDMSTTFNKRTKRLGTFYANSLAELKSNIKKLLEEAVSGEVIDDCNVILYKITTSCSYCLSGSTPVPNGVYLSEKDLIDGHAKWYEGSDRDRGENCFEFSVYAHIYHKQVLRFKSGAVKTFYWAMGRDKSSNLGKYGKMLNDYSLKAYDIKDAYGSHSYLGMNGKLEMHYTEDGAKFFCDMLHSICVINERIKGFIKEPEKLQMLINSQVKLIQ